MNKYKVDAVPHLICGGFSKEETENALIDLQFLGIDNVLALEVTHQNRKHIQSTSERPSFCFRFDSSVNDMNHGKYIVSMI